MKTYDARFRRMNRITVVSFAELRLDGFGASDGLFTELLRILESVFVGRATGATESRLDPACSDGERETQGQNTFPSGKTRKDALSPWFPRSRSIQTRILNKIHF